MKFKISIQSSQHTDMATACSWTPKNDLYTCSDDKTIHKWNMDGDSLGKVCDLDTYVTDMDWCPSLGKQKSDVFAIACSNGVLKIMNGNGREDKKVEAHKGCAVISVRWNYDGSAILTAGEEGSVKVWSRIGMLRSTVVNTGHPVYCAIWGPDDDQVLYSSGRTLTVKTLNKERKQLQWKAHEATVLSVDWNPVNNLIVSGGEDCRYRVWDSFGRQLYQSQPFDHVITAVKWNPNGTCFAVGAFDILRLCDKTGWSYCREETDCGSVFSLSWAADGTLLAGATANGDIIFAQTIEKQLDWKHISVTLSDVNQLLLTDNLNDEADYTETLEFRDRVIEFSIGYDHLVVATATQIYIYNVDNINAPNIFDTPPDTLVNLIVQSSKYFLTVDNIRGVQVYSYEGRKVSSPTFPGMRVEFLNNKTISISSDTVAIIDKADNKTIRIFDAQSGRAIGNGKMQHNMELSEVELSQMEDTSTRLFVFIDRNRDLYIAPVSSDIKDTRKPIKIQSMVDSACWNDNSDMLVALADGKIITWYYPQVVWVDGDLLPTTRVDKEVPEYGKIPQIMSYFGNQVVVRRADGSLQTSFTSPYPAMLYDFIKSSSLRWEDAVRLCRFVDSATLWATLASMAIHERHLDTAEIALAAINQVDKLHYILYIKEIPSEKGKMAELALYRRDAASAEQILLHANPPLVYRAIKMNIRLCQWLHALELAIQYKKHIDTVLYYRNQYLEAHERKETIDLFIEYAEKVEVDEEKVKKNKQREKEIELGNKPSDSPRDEEESEGEDHK